MATMQHASGALAVLLLASLFAFRAPLAQAQPANDDLADAFEVTGIPFSDVRTNESATLETNEALPSCGSWTNSIWWRFSPDADQRVVLYVDQTDGGFGQTLSLWTGDGHTLNELSCV
ncbi:hypothetical protein [Rhodocaloribacter sp.]